MKKVPPQPLYISVDIEASGPVPGRYSMLSLGACIIGETEQTFYRELQPISDDYDVISMKVGSLGLHCLKPYIQNPNFDPYDDSFCPKDVLDLLHQVGTPPQKAIAEFSTWIRHHSQHKEPWLVTDIQPFDGMFLQWYFGTYSNSESPFGYKAINLDMLYKGLEKNIEASLSDLNVPDTRNPAHNALEDAIHQAKQAEVIFKRMNFKV